MRLICSHRFWLNANQRGPCRDPLHRGLNICDGQGHNPTNSRQQLQYPQRAGASVSVTLSNLLPLAGAALVPVSEGEYVGDGLHPVPTKVATKIQRWEFIKMGELLPEFLASQGKDNLEGKCEPRIRRSWKVTDILMWVKFSSQYAPMWA